MREHGPQEAAAYARHLIDYSERLMRSAIAAWPAGTYEEGRGQASLDKQFVRDYLESIGWSKQPPVPELPDRIVQGARERYVEIFRILTGGELG